MRRRLACIAILVVAGACGQHYEPEQLETTGRPASPLGQVIDLDVSLSNFLLPGAPQRGLDFEMRLEIEGTGFGRLSARYFTGAARWSMGSGQVRNIGDGRVDVLVTPDDWTTGRIGPLSVDGTTFEVVLDGTPAGFGVSGRSWESQTGLFGTFEGWRRHRFLVATTDFAAGGQVVEVSWVRGREVRVRGGLELTSPDPFVRRTGRSVFVVNRLSHDNLQRLDPDADFRTSWQAGMGVGANPHDVLWLSADKLYVSRYA